MSSIRPQMSLTLTTTGSTTTVDLAAASYAVTYSWVVPKLERFQVTKHLFPIEAERDKTALKQQQKELRFVVMPALVPIIRFNNLYEMTGAFRDVTNAQADQATDTAFPSQEAEAKHSQLRQRRRRIALLSDHDHVHNPINSHSRPIPYLPIGHLMSTQRSTSVCDDLESLFYSVIFMSIYLDYFKTTDDHKENLRKTLKMFFTPNEQDYLSMRVRWPFPSQDWSLGIRKWTVMDVMEDFSKLVLRLFTAYFKPLRKYIGDLWRVLYQQLYMVYNNLDNATVLDACRKCSSIFEKAMNDEVILKQGTIPRHPPPIERDKRRRTLSVIPSARALPESSRNRKRPRLYIKS
ncbi:hypothetical protein DXG01_009786 [Tephrocybe rancida]|nr:hypothetical protein DXG01_009786 [Tephrocybe rancida]